MDAAEHSRGSLGVLDADGLSVDARHEPHRVPAVEEERGAVAGADRRDDLRHVRREAREQRVLPGDAGWIARRVFDPEHERTGGAFDQEDVVRPPTFEARGDGERPGVVLTLDRLEESGRRCC